MKCLVVGSGGYLGGAIERSLRASGHDLLTVSGPFSNRTAGRYVYTEGLYTALQPELTGVEAVIYAAGRVVPSTNVTVGEAIALDLKPLAELIDSLARCERRPAFVFISSAGAVYGSNETGEPFDESHVLRPRSVYGLVRSMMEQVVTHATQANQVRALSLRLSNVYGPGQRLNGPSSFIARAVHACLTQSPMELWGDGLQRKDFVFVDDVVSAVLKAIGHLGGTQSFATALNICHGDSVAIRDVMHTVEKACERPVPFVSKPMLRADVSRVELSNRLALDTIGWQPATALIDGIRSVAAAHGI